MKIYSMTATFGNLENKTLTLKPGLNVIHAPNEWGKSTWCAFLIAMLYGIDTKERTTPNHLAAKDRYAPWSGAPMSGRMDICWNGRDITIERFTRGRTPMGQFAAFETATGIPVNELTADNCGQLLLGVERSVFVRAGFVRLADMPLTNDESLRRRLNALVTTGDESGASDALAEKLKDLKNDCRYNRTGLLPQAESQQADLKNKLQQLCLLQQKCQGIRQEQEVLQEQLKQLENHKAALEYATAQEDLARVQAANNTRAAAAAVMQEMAERCEALPSEQTAHETLAQLRALQQQWNLLQAEPQPVEPIPVQPPAAYQGLTGEQAVQQADRDFAALQNFRKPVSPVFLIGAGVAVAGAVGLALVNWLFSIPCGALALILTLLYIIKKQMKNRNAQKLLAQYGLLDAKLWIPLAEKFRTDSENFIKARSAYLHQVKQLQERRESLTQQTAALTQGMPLAASISSWEKILTDHADLRDAQQNWKRASDYAADLAAMVKPVQEPAFPDSLTITMEQTQQALTEVMAESRQLDLQLGQCEGQMQSLGQQEVLEAQLAQIAQRIEKLEDIYSALTIAQETLAEAAETLQRRFAPKITKAAQKTFAQLTADRYDRLLLGQDFSVSAGAQGENVLRSGMWRSDGTVDQLYLALRLAVANELTPQAPLVLDDALVRFDETRLGLALDILEQTAEQKQVILFTCQSREQAYLDGK